MTVGSQSYCGTMAIVEVIVMKGKLRCVREDFQCKRDYDNGLNGSYLEKAETDLVYLCLFPYSITFHSFRKQTTELNTISFSLLRKKIS